jgi:uncharacterized membrane protein
MDKMLVAVFDNETAAFDGLSALRDLHRDGYITFYAWAVIVKDGTGKTSVKQALEEGGPPLGAALGLLTDKLLKLVRGPAGLAIGTWRDGLPAVARRSHRNPANTSKRRLQSEAENSDSGAEAGACLE